MINRSNRLCRPLGIDFFCVGAKNYRLQEMRSYLNNYPLPSQGDKSPNNLHTTKNQEICAVLDEEILHHLRDKKIIINKNLKEWSC